ncbi:hypothetical protein [Chitinolyticbacter albus]|uniref:hypothetical protein n=1 Tax=Chitinolyticbacter albus TaxID=2961951 RepID=UPI00210A1204|nr:hypothetical protein [Chitinolyticbacter albus]
MPFCHLSPDQITALQRQLSDLEAGSVRQWFWLELAHQRPASNTRRVRALAWLLQRGGPALAWPWLRCSGTPGTTLYAGQAVPLWRGLAQSRQDGLLLLLCLSALLAGFERLPASQAFAAWCIAGFGALWQASRARTPVPSADDDADDGEALPGPESSLGLAGILISRGVAPRDAMTLVALLQQQGDAALTALLHALPELAPPAPRPAAIRVLRAGNWLGATLPPSLLIAQLPAPWGLLAAAACGMACAGVRSRMAGLLVGMATLIAYALGRIGHVL